IAVCLTTKNIGACDRSQSLDFGWPKRVSRSNSAMPTSSRPSGVRVTTSDAIAVVDSAPHLPPQRRARSGRLFGPLPMPSTAAASSAIEYPEFLAALTTQEMTIVDEVELEARPGAVSARRGAQAESASIELELEADEGAVVLLEQDGLYSWRLPSQIE